MHLAGIFGLHKVVLWSRAHEGHGRRYTGQKPKTVYLSGAAKASSYGHVGLACRSLWILVLSDPEVETCGSPSVWDRNKMFKNRYHLFLRVSHTCYFYVFIHTLKT